MFIVMDMAFDELPYWKRFSSIPQDVLTLYECFDVRKEFKLSEALRFEMIPCRKHLYSLYPNESLDCLSNAVQIFGYLGNRFPCLGTISPDETIHIAEGFRRLKALASLTSQKSQSLDDINVVFYLRQEFQESDWLTLLLYEAEYCVFPLEKLSFRRSLSLSLLHKMVWGNPRFTEFSTKLPSNTKGFADVIKSVFPDISMRMISFYLHSRLFSFPVFEKLCTVLSNFSLPLTTHSFEASFGSIFNLLSTIHITLKFFTDGLTDEPPIFFERKDRLKKILLEGSVWFTLLANFNDSAERLLSSLSLPSESTSSTTPPPLIRDVCQSLAALLRNLLKDQLDRDLVQLAHPSQDAVQESLLNIPLLRRYAVTPSAIQHHMIFQELFKAQQQPSQSCSRDPAIRTNVSNNSFIANSSASASPHLTSLNGLGEPVHQSQKVIRRKRTNCSHEELNCSIQTSIRTLMTSDSHGFSSRRKRCKAFRELRLYVCDQQPALFASVFDSVCIAIHQFSVIHPDIVSLDEIDDFFKSIVGNTQDPSSMQDTEDCEDQLIDDLITETGGNQSPHHHTSRGKNTREPLDRCIEEDDDIGEDEPTNLSSMLSSQPNQITSTHDSSEEWEDYIKEFHKCFGYAEGEIIQNLPSPQSADFIGLRTKLLAFDPKVYPTFPYLKYLRRKSNGI